jgi:hypothetical protein
MINGITEINMLMTFVEILMDEKSSDRVKDIRLEGLKQLGSFLTYYTRQGYRFELITAIAEKKSKMIKEATTKAEIDKIVKPRIPYFNGNKFVPDKYIVLEEEMICWSEASFVAPLNDIAFQRYMELLKEILPEQASLIEKP